jgi:hypothetical protein
MDKLSVVKISHSVLALGDVANKCELSSIGKIEYFREENAAVCKLFGNDRLACVSGCFAYIFLNESTIFFKSSLPQSSNVIKL